MEVIFRPAFPDEFPRARSLFSNPPETVARWFVATRQTPVERLVAAVWHRTDAEGVEFDWTLHGSGGTEWLPDFLAAWKAHLRAASDTPPRIRLHGGHEPGAAGALRARLAGLTEDSPPDAGAERIFSGPR